jgi:spoIIIJ-associated protein
MQKVEADTLEEAYQKAAIQLACSVADLQYEVIQHPSKGILGFLKKKAIIVASCGVKAPITETVPEKTVALLPTEEESVATEILTVVQNELSQKEEISVQEDVVEKIEKTIENDVVLDNFFAADKDSSKEVEKDDSSDEIP